jgi:glyoxylase-like metal-dependent hydrolase (beta-lactamase superfamily II)
MATRQSDARSIMPIHICSACGTSYPETATPPARCPICEDERQFVPRSGQSWTTPEALAARHSNAWRQLEAGLFEIHTRPDFAISQRALLIRTPQGNILWDCLTLIDEATVAIVKALGGLTAIAISHPHYYSRLQDWAQAFGAPVYLSAGDRDWVMRPDAAIRFFGEDKLALAEGVTLLRLGGHFPGGTVLHWAGGAGGKGALLSGDILQVTPGGDRVSMLFSYPNMLPLSAGTVKRMASALDPWAFERIYGAFPGREVMKGAKAAVARSVARYVELLAEER